MAQASARLPSHLLPKSKAAATSSSTASLDAASATHSSHTSRASSQRRLGSPRPPTPPPDRATAAFVRRNLCPLSEPSRPLEELLPPLTSRNDIDLELYAIIAIIVKDFVYSWYSKFTTDQTFVAEVVQIIAHCTRDLEQRARRVNLGELLLNDIPALIERHTSAYRAANNKQYPPPVPTNPREVYHTLIPHPAFSPVPKISDFVTGRDQAENEAIYRQLLVQSVLAVLLPTDDLNNPCLRTLVGDVLGDLILGKGIGAKACEGWVIWDGVRKVASSIKSQTDAKVVGRDVDVDTRSRLEKFGLLSGTDETVDSRHGRQRKGLLALRGSIVSEFFWRGFQYAYLAYLATRFIVTGLVAAGSAPQRIRRATKGGKSNSVGGADGRASPIAFRVQAPAGSSERPVLSYSVFGMISDLLELSWRMPWVVGGLALVKWHLVRLPQAGATDGLIDK